MLRYNFHFFGIFPSCSFSCSILHYNFNCIIFLRLFLMVLFMFLGLVIAVITFMLFDTECCCKLGVCVLEFLIEVYDEFIFFNNSLIAR